MKILGYNSRGLNKATAVRALLKLLKRHGPDMVFLSETHLDEWPAECLRRSLGMDFKEVVRSDGRSGGLLLLWKKEITVSLRHKTNSYIDVFVGERQSSVWRFTGFYGEPRWQDKYKSWERLSELHAATNLPWLVMGDMNEILFQYEKEGGNPRPDNFMQDFRNAIEACGLSDCGFVGDKFTWHRGRIRERLDRALANDNWRRRFGDAILQHLDYGRSDHRPILMCLEAEVQQVNEGPGILRFEAKWLKEANFQQVVESAWERSASQATRDGLAGKLAAVHELLHKWDMSVLQSTNRKLRSTQKDLERVATGPLSDENVARQQELAHEIEFLREHEEIRWAQRSRLNWLQHGDKNTSYFHNFANARRKKNMIHKLKDDSGAWVEGFTNLNPLISQYFAGLFTTEVEEPDP